MTRKFRLYIDEVGNSDLNASVDPNHRYLCVAGIAIDLDLVKTTFAPALERIKERYLDSHPDEPVILHRKELVNKAPPFAALRDPDIEQGFNRDFLGLLEATEYTVFLAIIDKQAHREKYNQWRHDPYHYCQEILIERYVLWLGRQAAIGDALAESRGKKEDIRLKTAYSRIYEHGTNYIRPETLQARLTSGALKLRKKTDNVAGLQLADVIAHPCFRVSLADRSGLPRPQNFGLRIAEIVEATKYHRNGNGVIDGYGRKWLP